MYVMCMGGSLFACPAKVCPGLVQYSYVKQVSSIIASIMSQFSNNYLRFSYVLGNTERLAFRRLIVIYIT